LDALWTLVRTLIRLSRGWRIVVVTRNFQNCHENLQSLFRDLDRALSHLASDYLFLTSSAAAIPDLCTRQKIIDLGLDAGRLRLKFIQLKAESLASQLPVLRGISHAQLLEQLGGKNLHSYTDADRYMRYLSRNLPLSTPEAIVRGIKQCPSTTDEITRSCILRLLRSEAARDDDADRTFLRWCELATSWTQRAARYLQPKELATAIAVGLCSGAPSTILDVSRRVSAAISTDIDQHLGLLLTVDDGYVRPFSPAIKRFLDKKMPSYKELRPFKLLGDEQLAEFCLEYLSMVLLPEKWEQCLTQVTWRGSTQSVAATDGSSNLEFLDYACRHWPTHYRNSYSQLGNCNALEEPVLKLLDDPDRRSKWYRLFRVTSSCSPAAMETLFDDNAFGDVTALEIVIELGLSPLVHVLLPKHVGSLDTLLSIAIRHERSDLVDVLRGRGATGEVAILDAARNGNVEVLQQWIDGGILTDRRDLGSAALCQAAWAGRSLAVEALLSSGLVSAGWVDADGTNALHSATISGRLDLCENIIQKLDLGRNLVNARDSDGRTPLMLAARLAHVDIMKLLCRKGADVAQSDNNEKTALHFAILSGLEAVELLLQNDAGPSDRDVHGQTPLHVACRLGDDAIVQRLCRGLLQSQKSVDIQDEHQQTPLHVSAASGHTAIIRLLIDQGADKDAKDEKDYRPIELAASMGHLAAIKALQEQHVAPKSATAATTAVKDENLLLCHAAECGQVLVVRYLMERGVADSNELVRTSSKREGSTALTAAASSGYTEVVRTLITLGADKDKKDGYGYTPLHRAAESRHLDVVRILLEKGANQHLLDRSRRAPLHLAARGGVAAMVAELIKHGADVNGQTLMKFTVLHLSITHPNVVRLLIDKGANLDTPNYEGVTPLHLAIENKKVVTAQILADRGADVESADEDGLTPFHYAIRYGTGTEMLEIIWKRRGEGAANISHAGTPLVVHAAKYGNLDAIRFLLDKGLDTVSSVNSDGDTALHLAAGGGNEDIVAELLDKHAEVNSRGAEKRTPLHVAADNGRTGVMTLLLDREADINAQDDEERTALFLAAYRGKTEAAELLLRRKADVGIPGPRGQTPLHVAVDSLSMTILLLENGASMATADSRGWTPLLQAVYWEHVDIIEALLEKGADINYSDPTGRTPLHIAAQDSSSKVVEVLIDWLGGAEPGKTDDKGASPLHYAAESPFHTAAAEVARKLLKIGLSSTSKDHAGRTPLHYAAGRGLSSVMEAIIQHRRDDDPDADIDDRDHAQCTPLHYAVRNHGSDGLELLLKMGARPEAGDKSGRNCMAMLAGAVDERDGEEIFDLLLATERDKKREIWKASDLGGLLMAMLNRPYTVRSIAEKLDAKRFATIAESAPLLEECVKRRRGDETAVCFLQLGANPFRRREGKPSAFQLAASVNDRQSWSKFVSDCLVKLQDVVRRVEDEPDLEDCFHALCVCAQMDSRQAERLLRDVPLAMSAMKDGDGWTLQLLRDMRLNTRQQPPNATLLPTASPTLVNTEAPSRLVVPESWARSEDDDGDGVEITDPTNVAFTSQCLY